MLHAARLSAPQSTVLLHAVPIFAVAGSGAQVPPVFARSQTKAPKQLDDALQREPSPVGGAAVPAGQSNNNSSVSTSIAPFSLSC